MEQSPAVGGEILANSGCRAQDLGTHRVLIAWAREPAEHLGLEDEIWLGRCLQGVQRPRIVGVCVSVVAVLSWCCHRCQLLQDSQLACQLSLDCSAQALKLWRPK